MFKTNRKRLSELIHFRAADDLELWVYLLSEIERNSDHWASKAMGEDKIQMYVDNSLARLNRITRYRRRKGWI